VDEAGMEAWLDGSSSSSSSGTSSTSSSRGQAAAQHSAVSEHSSSQPGLEAGVATAAELQLGDDLTGVAEHLSSTLLSSQQQATQADHAAAAATAAAAAGGGRDSQSQVTLSLVAYPSKDNYEGRLYSLDWVKKVSGFVGDYCSKLQCGWSAIAVFTESGPLPCHTSQE
jgi:hypothetical protein